MRERYFDRFVYLFVISALGDAYIPNTNTQVDKFLKKFKKISLKHQNSNNPTFTKDLWDVITARANYPSRNANALPLSFKEMQSAQSIGSAETRLPRSIRDLNWLEANGRCMDNIHPNNSTVAQAGRGAFASRFVPDGGTIAPGPLLHVPNRTALQLYGIGEDGARDPARRIGMQLILNYCFGHAESTVILCPYTSPSAYVNHATGEKANAEVRWAEDGTPGHNSDWLEESVSSLKWRNEIGLSLNFVATRDIQPGEEVFIDYGPEWENAWNKHVKEWAPPPDSENYASATILQSDSTIPLRTPDEQRTEPYSKNVVFYCHYGYQPGMPEGEYAWMDEWGGPDGLTLYPCRIVRREAVDMPGPTGAVETFYHYAMVMLDEDAVAELGGIASGIFTHVIPSGENHILTYVPRWAIEIRDWFYSKDEFMENSFRHEMMIPDEIFPDAWKNLRE